MKHYVNLIKPIIENILRKDMKPFVYEKTVFGINAENSLKTAHYVRQMQMKEGKIARACMGSFYGWNCDESGPDLKKIDNSCVIELKNKYNTCNSSSLDKLATYKKNNKDTLCVYGIMNPKSTKKLSLQSKKLIQKIIHNNQEIYKIQGEKLLKLVYTYKGYDYSTLAVKAIKEIIKETINTT